eukprot:ANDGO_00964.mRNA.1 hypothetical protein SDRG_04477
MADSLVQRIIDELASTRDPSSIPYSEYISLLQEYRSKCVLDSQYEEASLAKTVLEKLKVAEEREVLHSIRQRQAAERRGVDEAHIQEFEQFRDMWDQRLGEYESHASELESAMKERHLMEFRQFHEEIQAAATAKPKFSKQLLNLRAIERTLAKQEKYEEATKMKGKADRMEKKELGKWQDIQDKAFVLREQRLILRQQQELKVLMQRIEAGRAEQYKLRDADMKRIALRYANVRKGLEQAQNIEKARTDKFLANHERKKNKNGESGELDGAEDGSLTERGRPASLSRRSRDTVSSR